MHCQENESLQAHEYARHDHDPANAFCECFNHAQLEQILSKRHIIVLWRCPR
jgi:hypothetical protein